MKRIGLALLVVYALLLLATPGASARRWTAGLPGRPPAPPRSPLQGLQEWRNSPLC